MKHQRNLSLFIVVIVLVATLVVLVFSSSEQRTLTHAPVSVQGIQISKETTAVSANPNTVYLTFDDGPNPDYTSQILDLLKANNANATFFAVGLWADRFPEIIQRAAREGHSIQNHTYDHHRLTQISPELFHYEIARAQDAVTNAAGKTPKCVRAPYQSYDQQVTDAVNAMNLQLIRWTIDPQDWRNQGVAPIVQNVVDHVAPDSIILLHDGGGDRSETVAAVGEILKTLRERNYAFGVLCS